MESNKGVGKCTAIKVCFFTCIYGYRYCTCVIYLYRCFFLTILCDLCVRCFFWSILCDLCVPMFFLVNVCTMVGSIPLLVHSCGWESTIAQPPKPTAAKTRTTNNPRGNKANQNSCNILSPWPMSLF